MAPFSFNPDARFDENACTTSAMRVPVRIPPKQRGAFLRFPAATAGRRCLFAGAACLLSFAGFGALAQRYGFDVVAGRTDAGPAPCRGGVRR